MNGDDGGYQGVEQSIILKKGEVRMKSRRLGIWRKRYVLLFAPSSKGPTRFVKYADERGFKEEKQLSFFRMQDVTTVVRLSINDEQGITISLAGGEIRQFLCFDANEAEDWLQKLQTEAGKSDSLPIGLYRAYLIPNNFLNFDGECVVEVTADHVNVYEDVTKSRKVVGMKISCIRRYTSNPERRNNNLLIENGRSQEDVGESLLLFKSYQAEDIFKHLDRSAKRLRGSVSSANSSNGSYNPRLGSLVPELSIMTE
ncbi:docking protein 5-like isoform X2 [Crassostrea virginica]|uniref:Docking protein 5-like isoform X2 n=1 Tax=Crassostrea virginica TaxID=6565 RepID=A0A8B8EE43_CRAVI|nr:docking protein 5-like isoform X2 [Crassostrea virginica]XP_022337835.1 docking protein 5-like isoform X2 [Crassostrea virginica]XP_022337836.1 docking protein 5-like isoform X2 [Crassostrea virginica]